MDISLSQSPNVRIGTHSIYPGRQSAVRSILLKYMVKSAHSYEQYRPDSRPTPSV
jgi:hypothetical protein